MNDTEEDVFEAARSIRERIFDSSRQRDHLRSWAWVNRQHAMTDIEAVDVFLAIGPSR